MQLTTDVYKKLLNEYHWKEVRLSINDSAPDKSLDEATLISMKTYRQVFPSEAPAVGGCIAGEIAIEMEMPTKPIPRQAKLKPYVRLTNGTEHSEWVQKGIYYIDTRKKTEDGSDFEILTIQGYDDILKTEQDYPETTLSWPALDIDVVKEIAAFIGVPVDARTIQVMTNAYQVGYPAEYSCRETLGYIAAMYGGSFVMSDVGKLQLITLGDVFADDDQTTSYLITEDNYNITVGGVRILV